MRSDKEKELEKKLNSIIAELIVITEQIVAQNETQSLHQDATDWLALADSICHESYTKRPEELKSWLKSIEYMGD